MALYSQKCWPAQSSQVFSTFKKWALDILLSHMTATHCECFLQRHLPNNTSWWTLCSPRSRSSASRAGRWLPHTSCGNMPSTSMQASVQTGTGEMMTGEISGGGGNESRHNHINCAAGLSRRPEWYTPSPSIAGSLAVRLQLRLSVIWKQQLESWQATDSHRVMMLLKSVCLALQ